jgi:hypothetical protein
MLLYLFLHLSGIVIRIFIIKKVLVLFIIGVVFNESYAFYHAIRKNFSNIKTTISEEWRQSCDKKDLESNSNSSCFPLKPDSLWNRHSFFDNKNDAALFMGTNDSIFLFFYAFVNKSNRNL